MLALKKVAITGGISSGKSTACHLFKECGAYTVSADEIVHKLLIPQSDIGKQVIHLLGRDVVREGVFVPGLIGKKVFTDEQKLKSLEAILHPAVLKEIEEQYARAKALKQSPLFIAEIPLLYEIEHADAFDLVIAIEAESALCAIRFQKITKHRIEEFEKRMRRQLPPKQKRERADITIQNNGSLAELKAQIQTLYQHLTQQE